MAYKISDTQQKSSYRQSCLKLALVNTIADYMENNDLTYEELHLVLSEMLHRYSQHAWEMDFKESPESEVNDG